MDMAVKDKLSRRKRQELLKVLTYEKVKGKPIYYRGYREVLKGELNPEAVMGSGELHAILLFLIGKFLMDSLGENYIVLGGELGFFTSPNSFRSLDVAVYRKEDMKNPADGYTKKPPLVVVEIDTKADLSRYSSFEEYMYEKTGDLLRAGVQKVIWYITKVRKVLIAEAEKDWITTDWDRDIEVLEGVRLNLKELLNREGIEVRWEQLP